MRRRASARRCGGASAAAWAVTWTASGFACVVGSVTATGEARAARAEPPDDRDRGGGAARAEPPGDRDRGGGAARAEPPGDRDRGGGAAAGKASSCNDVGICFATYLMDFPLRSAFRTCSPARSMALVGTSLRPIWNCIALTIAFSAPFAGDMPGTPYAPGFNASLIAASLYRRPCT